MKINKTKALLELDISICKDSLYEFVKRSWPVLFSERPFIEGKLINLMCYSLELAYYGIETRQIINVPYRHMKSVLTTQFFPAWVWTKAPHKQFLCASHSWEVIERNSTNCKNLIASEWYQERFPIEFSDDLDRKLSFKNSKNGRITSVTILGQGHGLDADFVLVDDPTNPKKALSDKEREKINTVFDQTLATRLIEPLKGAIMVIMQRVHQQDLTGHLLTNNNSYLNIVLPAEYDGFRYETNHSELNDWRTDEGEALWPERFSTDVLEVMKKDLVSSSAISSQLQQLPVPVGGLIFKEDWFANRYVPDKRRIVARYVSWDTAGSINGAYSAGIVGDLLDDYKLFIRKVVRFKKEFPEMINEVERVADEFGDDLLRGIIIEDKSTGSPLIQTLKQSSKRWIRKLVMRYVPKQDKDVRGYAAAKWCEVGRIVLPPATSEFGWLNDFEDELFNLPYSAYRDQGDAFAQLILKLESKIARGYKDETDPVSPYHSNELNVGALL